MVSGAPFSVIPYADKRKIVVVRQWYVFRVSLGLLAVAIAMPAQSGPGTELLIQQVEARYNSVKTLSVDFVQSFSILGHGRPDESGTLTLRKAGKMRWDYRQPQGKLFVSDGKTIFLYTAKDNRVEKVALKATDDMRAPLAFLLGKLDMKREFRDIAAHENASGTVLIAQSKSDGLPYKSVEMLLSGGGRIDRLVVRGRDESVTSYQFGNEKLNPPVHDEMFHFQIPPGAQVVDALESHQLESQQVESHQVESRLGEGR